MFASYFSRVVSHFGGSVRHVVVGLFLLAITLGVIMSPVTPTTEVTANTIIGVPTEISGGVKTFESAQEASSWIFDLLNGLALILGAFAVAVLSWGGFRYMNNKPDEGKQWVRYGAVGLAVVISARIIASLVVAVVGFLYGQVRGGGTTTQ